jgi:hypothetical protein
MFTSACLKRLFSVMASLNPIPIPRAFKSFVVTRIGSPVTVRSILGGDSLPSVMPWA